MSTMFGKFCRVLRIKHDEVLRDMAKKLGVSSSYLSAVENGKRSTPQSWRNELIRLYNLTNDESEELDNAMCQSIQKITFDLNRYSSSDRDTLVLLAHSYDNMDEKIKTYLNALLKGREKD